MAESRAAYRYARALIDIAEEQKALDRVGKDFEVVEKLAKDSPDFRLFLRSPVINKEKKKTVFTEVLQKSFAEVTFKFILLLASRNRETILPEIIEQFYRLRDERLGIENTTVFTAIELTKDQEQRLVTRCEQITRKKVRLHSIIDPALKGGVRVQIGDTVWDGSITRQLELLRQRFVEGAQD